jgi:hypothetical protein
LVSSVRWRDAGTVRALGYPREERMIPGKSYGRAHVPVRCCHERWWVSGASASEHDDEARRLDDSANYAVKAVIYAACC